MEQRLSVGVVSGILHPRYGGPATVVKHHAAGLAALAHVEVFGVYQPEELEALTTGYPAGHFFPSRFPQRWFRGSGLGRSLLMHATSLDLFHAHMAWDYPVAAAAFAAGRRKRPLVISPHGSFSGAWRYGSLHKRLYKRCLLEPLLGDRIVLHALNVAEADGLRAAGFSGPIGVIPNGLPGQEYQRRRDPTAAAIRWPTLRGRRICLYLGRLWAEKGLELLLRAWAEARERTDMSEWILVIAGPDYKNYRAILEEGIREFGLAENVILLGEVYGQDKHSILDAASIFVLPSKGEGFSMAILEAIAAGKPVIFSQGCNFSELASTGGGIEVAFEVTSIRRALEEYISLSESDLLKLGRRGWELGSAKYTTERVSRDLIALYEQALALPGFSRRV